MNKGEYIQLGIFLVMSITLLVISYQLTIQKSLLKAQSLKDLFEMNWRLFDPIPQREIDELDIYPEGYMSQEKYNEIYKDNHRKRYKYILMYHAYEYLVFTYYMKELKLPFKYEHPTMLWAKELVKEKEFVEVHEYNKSFYPDTAEFIDQLINSVKSEQG